MNDPLAAMYVWHQTVDDGRFRCFVVRDSDDGYLGTLHVEVVAGNEKVLEERVVLSYAARFGPDVDDVQTWQARCIEAIDAWIAGSL